MKKVTVYRLEDSTGLGVYYDNAPDHVQDEFGRANCSYMELIEATGIWYNARHPEPHEDNLAWEDLQVDKCVFGFSSLKQFKSWIFKKKWRQDLASIGVLLNKYEVDTNAVAKGDSQVIFMKENASLIQSFRPDFAG